MHIPVCLCGRARSQWITEPIRMDSYKRIRNTKRKGINIIPVNFGAEPSSSYSY